MRIKLKHIFGLEKNARSSVQKYLEGFFSLRVGLDKKQQAKLICRIFLMPVQ